METLHTYPLLRAELAICGGALPGFLASQANLGGLRRRRGTKLDHLLATVGPVPPAPGYTHYLPCALLGNANLAASQPSRGPALTTGAWAGVLYVGPSGLQFRASPAKGAAAGQGQLSASLDSPPSFDITPVRAVVATSVLMSHAALGRSTAREPRYALHVRWPTGHALFGVPAIGDTLPRLHRCLDTLRWDGRGDMNEPVSLPGTRSAVL
jgi:hypothetical protein